ncbi:tRNA (adenosine(37)-N6)-threonylcarbamoyltransferase complex ATPase subunit type 1 TsaE [Lapidilactobacillus luobeiensis]|uniref:tRNA (adenosine(37)-N6)-threonylcarbamoyltransferase complex ATPase subunit type 1 TsaE n=1 Tax=Lapidilactobacillus luobeiensis TaxID=2950371 RepID=UPI0035A22CC2
MAIGRLFGQQVVAGDVLLLNGDLGAGKTTFTQGLASALGIKRAVKSPTFTIIREYRTGRIPLFHMDLYRLEHSSAADLGLEEYFGGQGVCVVEWPQFGGDELPSDHLSVQIERVENDDQRRRFTLTATGPQANALLARLRPELALAHE